MRPQSDTVVTDTLRPSVALCFLCLILNHVAFGFTNTNNNTREMRKLFGGYRITPRFCRPTRTVPGVKGGPNICMFNHECSQRNGHVVGACMDGFLFGACCQLPVDEQPSVLSNPDTAVLGQDNSLLVQEESITAKIQPLNTDLLANEPPILLQTADPAEMVQMSSTGPNAVSFKPSTVQLTYAHTAETVLYHPNGSQVTHQINAQDFEKPSTQQPKPSTVRVESSTKPFYYHSSPLAFTKKTKRPPNPNQYVLVPTITHAAAPKPGDKNNTLPEIDSIVDIIQMLDDGAPNKLVTPGAGMSSTPPKDAQGSTTPSYYSSTSSLHYPGQPINGIYLFSPSPGTFAGASTVAPPPSTSYVYSSTFSPRPGPSSTTTQKTKRPPSTSYVFSSTPLSRPKPTKPSYILTASSTYRPATDKLPSTSYVYSPSPTRRPATHTTHKYGSASTTRPPTKASTRKPIIVGSHTSPGYGDQSAYPGAASQYSPFPSPPPTVIVLGPLAGGSSPQKHEAPGSATRPTPKPQVSQVTINNMITATNSIHYGMAGTRPATSERPAPTVLITPKPSASTVSTIWTQQPTIFNRPPAQRPADGSTLPVEYITSDEISTSTDDDLINFPPVRNPNLNMSVNTPEQDSDLTTPVFVEDANLDDKVETFVNKIIQSLQGPFDDLKNVVYKNKTTHRVPTSTKKPVGSKKPTVPTKKPLRVSTTPKVTTRKPTTKRPPPKRTTTRRPATTAGATTRRPTTLGTTRRPKPPRRPTTTTTPPSYIEQDPDDEDEDYAETVPQIPDYKRQCGVRPHMKSGRIVGGKGATFGQWPWQVLVRESTWLGLFTKNKCGGVLISSRYVITAAHCQPGFLAGLQAVFGEFDISGELESKRSVTKPVKRVIVHRQYDAATFENDLALLELETPISFDTHIVPICLPGDEEDFTGRMATVTGWGRLKYAGGVPSVLQEVQVPIMENSVCQEMFRTAGHSKVILESFLCAGYANGLKDSCEGDSGGPLVLQRADGRWELAGTVSHGIKCAAPYLPGVYMRTTYFKPWLSTITGVH